MTVRPWQEQDPAVELSPCKRNTGFTLIELLIVVAIIGVIASIAIPVYYQHIDKARVTVAYGTLDTVRKTLESFHIDNQEYPTTINFTTGLDGLARSVFQTTLLNQINNDFFSIDSYSGNSSTYTLVVKAKNSAHTTMTLTPQDIIY